MKIGVVGLGLIGGSIFKELRLKYNVVGVSSSVNEDNTSSDYSILNDCNLVFVCTPMNKTLETLDKIQNYIQETTIVTDVCSLKEFVSKKEYTYKFIPSHPMAGTEHKGWSNSFIGLFNGAKWVITPLNNKLEEEQKLLEKIITELGARPVITTPREHDQAVALISNLPLIIAQGLCKNIIDNPLAQEIASSGFKDTTRLALSNTEMATDMLNLNRENIEKSLESLSQSINYLLKDNYTEKIEEIKNFRKNLY